MEYASSWHVAEVSWGIFEDGCYCYCCCICDESNTCYYVVFWVQYRLKPITTSRHMWQNIHLKIRQIEITNKKSSNIRNKWEYPIELANNKCTCKSIIMIVFYFDIIYYVLSDILYKQSYFLLNLILLLSYWYWMSIQLDIISF